MNAYELIGKQAIRTAPILKDLSVNQTFGFGVTIQRIPDYSHCDKPIKIVNATDTHIVYEHCCYDGTTTICILDVRFCDGNWINYEDLITTEEDKSKGDK